MASPKFERLIRFVGPSGQIHLGELPKDHPWDAPLEGVVAALYDGGSPLDEHLKLNGHTAEVKHVLCPLPDVPFIYGVGLNYRRHAEEGGHKLPPYPKTFVKYSDAMTGPYEDVVVHPTATEVDYEVCLPASYYDHCARHEAPSPGPPIILLLTPRSFCRASSSSSWVGRSRTCPLAQTPSLTS